MKRFFSSTVERHLLVDFNEGILSLRMNRAKVRNALSRLLVTQLAEAIDEHQTTAKAVIISSADPGMFCAGADLKERKGMTPEEATLFVRKLRSTFTNFENMPCPTIAVLDGATVGGGLELALCADMRVCTKQAKLGLPETGLAILPGAGGTQRLPRVIGPALAKEMIFTADPITPERALEIGLINHLCEDIDAAHEKAKAIATRIGRNGPVGVRAAKQAVQFGMQMDLRSGLELEEACYSKVIPTEDRLEGLKAFAEKRQPIYKGK